MQRGEAAHDGGGVLSSSFQRQPRVVPLVLNGEKGGFQKFKQEILLKANMLDISDQLVGQGTQMVSVGDPLKPKAVMLREGFLSEEVKGAYQAWSV